MRDLLRGYARATFESVAAAAGTDAALGALERVHEELSVFSAALVRHERLRTALGDSAVPVSERRGIVVDLLEGKAAPETVSLLSFATRTEPAAELALSVAELVQAAEEHAAEGREALASAPEPPSGRQAARDRLRGYAERVLQELGSSEEVDEIEDELFRFARIVDAHPELRRMLVDVNRPLADRLAVLDELLASRTRPPTLRLTRYTLRAGRLRDLVGTLEWLVELAAAERGRRVAEVRSAVELDDAERERLAAALSRMVERNVEARTILDPSVIGGVLVTVGDLVIDGTVRLRFERLRDLLAQAS